MLDCLKNIRIKRINDNKIRLKYDIAILYKENTEESLVDYKTMSITLRKPTKYDISKSSIHKLSDYIYFKTFVNLLRTLSNQYLLNIKNIDTYIEVIHISFEDKMIILTTPVSIIFSGIDAKRRVRQLKIKKLLSES